MLTFYNNKKLFFKRILFGYLQPSRNMQHPKHPSFSRLTSILQSSKKDCFTRQMGYFVYICKLSYIRIYKETICH